MSTEQSTSGPKIIEDDKLDTPTRIDMEVYVMGDMKDDFINFLSEVFKSNFNETLSWGNFRRFQLIIQNGLKWLLIYFIILKKDQNCDQLLTTFKMYEKRNILLLLYNANDEKSKNRISESLELFYSERDKIYDGILVDETMKKNLKRITTDNVDVKTLKENLKFLCDRSPNNSLVYKIGFVPNLVNNRTSTRIKKGSDIVLYDIHQEIFYDEVAGEYTDFGKLMNLLISEHFTRVGEDVNELFEFDFDYKESKNNSTNQSKNNLNFVFKGIDWAIVLYLAIALYNFVYN